MFPIDLVLDPIAVPGIVSGKLWIKGGSGQDPTGQKGIHQLLSSLLSRGCGPFSHIALADLVEGSGAGLRCDTYEDGLLISLKCSDQDIKKLLPILGWMMTDPHMESGQVLLERELSLQAIQRQKENPFQQAFDGWRQLAYGNGPYGHDPLGLIEDIRQIHRDDLMPIAKNLKATKSVLALSGTINKKVVEDLKILEPFSSLSQHKPLTQKKPKIRNTSYEGQGLSPSNITLQSINTGQVVIMFGMPTVPHGHPDDLALRLLNSYLGSGMSSLLFKRLREEHGVAYEVGVHHPVREQAAPFVLHASTSEEKSLLTLELLISSLLDLKDKVLTNEDLSLAKAKFAGQMAHSKQTTSQRAERKAQLRGMNLPDDYDMTSLKEIKSIQPMGLRDIAIQYLRKPLLSLCGPKASLEKLSKYWDKYQYI